MKNKKLTIIAKIVAKPEMQTFVKKELIKLIGPTLQEVGCINYDFHIDNNNKNLFLFFENWESKALWKIHMESNHIKAFSKATENAIEHAELFEMTHYQKS